MCTGNREPRSYHRTGHGIVPLTCCLELYSQGLSKPLSIPECKAMEDDIKEALYTCIPVAVDRFSKACKLIPLRGLPTALKAPKKIQRPSSIISYAPSADRCLKDVVSDRGPQFVSRICKAFFKLLDVTISLSSGYHPQTNGQTEQKIQEIGRYHRAYCHDNQHSWNRLHPWAKYAQNSLKQATTGLTAFQCIPAYQPPLFPWTEEPSDVPAVNHWFQVSERVWDSAHAQLQQAVRRHKTYADARRSSTPVYCPGDKVLISTRDLCLRLPSRKLSPRYIGPFTIKRQINEVTFRLQLPAQYRIHPSFHVSLLEPVSPSVTEPDEPAVPPPPEIIEEPLVFRMLGIVASRRWGGLLEYLDLLGRIRDGRKVLGGPGRCSGSLSPGRVSPEPP